MLTVIVEYGTHCDIIRVPAKKYSAFLCTLFTTSPTCRCWIGGGEHLPAYSYTKE